MKTNRTRTKLRAVLLVAIGLMAAAPHGEVAAAPIGEVCAFVCQGSGVAVIRSFTYATEWQAGYCAFGPWVIYPYPCPSRSSGS